jgi:hypothetical protein
MIDMSAHLVPNKWNRMSIAPDRLLRQVNLSGERRRKVISMMNSGL